MSTDIIQYSAIERKGKFDPTNIYFQGIIRVVNHKKEIKLIKQVYIQRINPDTAINDARKLAEETRTNSFKKYNKHYTFKSKIILRKEEIGSTFF